MTRTRKRVRVAMAILGAFIGGLLLAAPALAGYVHGPSFTVGFEKPAGVAVEQASGIVYVAGEGGKVEKLNKEGAPENFSALSSPQISVPGGAANLYQLAVDNSATSPSKGDLYVPDFGDKVVYRYKPTGELDGEITGLTVGAAIAVDASGNVYIGQYEAGNVLEFGPTGTPVNAGKPVLEGIVNPNALAFNSAGDLYVAENKLESGTVEFEPNGKGGFKELSKITKGGPAGSLGVTVDLSTDNVFVDNNEALEEFDKAGAPVGAAFGPLESSNAVAINETSKAVYATNRNRVAVEVFEPGQPLTVHKTGTGKGLVTSNPAGIDCAAEEAECKAEFVEGDKVILEETPEPGNKFLGWSGGVCSGTEKTCEVTMSGPIEVTAKYEELPKFKFNVSLEGTGKGEVMSSPPGIKCELGGLECTTEFGETTKVVLTATPAPGSEFTGWSGGGCSGTGTCEIEVTAETNVKAKFDLIPKVKLTVSQSGSTGKGTVTSAPPGINCGTECEAEIEVGTEVELKETPATGSKFVKWSEGCSGTTETCKFKITAATTVKAEFSQNPPTVTTEGSSSVTASTATVAGKVDPNGGATECKFEYGPTTAYGSVASCTASPGGGTSPVAVSASLSGLSSHSTYHYRLVASNAGGPKGGADAKFATEESKAEKEAKAKAEQEAKEKAEKEAQEKAAKEAKEKAEKEAQESGAASLTITKVKVSASAVTVTLTASQSGAVTISGPGLKTTTKTIGAGTSQVKVSLNAAGKRARKHGKKIKITIKLTVGKKTVSESKKVKL